jgi:hypothetical protein
MRNHREFGMWNHIASNALKCGMRNHGRTNIECGTLTNAEWGVWSTE